MDGKASSQTKARIIVVMVFLIGFAAGGLSMNLYQRASGPETYGDRERRTPQDHIMRRLKENLNLNTDQQQQVSTIIDETFARYAEIRREMDPLMKQFEPRFNAVRQESRDRMRTVLTSDQLPKFEEMVREQDRRREKWAERNKK
jgi:hypothetical protein